MKHFNKIMTFLLLAISLFLTGCGLEFNGENSIYEYNDTDFIALSELSTCVDDIKNINIDWPKGNVTIQNDENLNVCIEITSDTDLDNELYLTRYKITDNTLFIKYCANGVNIGDFKEKSLKLIVPYKLEEVSINYVSCDFDLKNLEVKNLKLSGTSGHILINKIKCDSYDCKTVSSLNEFSDCSINNFLVSTVSGEVLVYSSILEKVKINSVSGITNLQLSELPKEIRVDSLSGDVNFYLPKYQTFGVYYDTKSGQFYSDLEIEELADIIYDVYTINGDLSIYEYVK